MALGTGAAAAAATGAALASAVALPAAIGAVALGAAATGALTSFLSFPSFFFPSSTIGTAVLTSEGLIHLTLVVATGYFRALVLTGSAIFVGAVPAG